MKPVVRWTLYQRRWSVFGWSLGSFFLIFINMVFYPSFRDDAAALQKSFESIPDTAVQFLGGSTDFFSAVGFLNSQIFYLMLPLLLGMLAIGLGSSLLAREEQDKTIEPLLARPVSRGNFLLAKATVGFCIVLFVSIVALLTTVIMSKSVDLDVSIGSMIIATMSCTLMALSFGAVALVITAFGKARVASLGLATVFALGGYLISSLAGTVDWLKIPSKLFPFYYYRPEQILRGNTDWMPILFFVAVIAASGLLSWVTFRRRDIG